MGGAKMMGMGNIKGVPYSESQTAFELFLFWVIGGWIFCGFFLVFQKISIPLVFYILVAVVLFFRYLNKELKNK